ncbi:glycosyltransferase family 2 protein [Roseofilum sp. BLCC_M154]|uniref:Glycosyltransferase family 2 protein n=1 Tax=Roseofilum acuticapitatum BLCC-M154 TaxID=3022444 RepID=A0ABT7AMK1_9CYAN|nr:glycosyltransferase family 2 protein [Roseofilum acuticapitatum]MDJ1168120.1 glycosyltransferase family 2 protein [Roseofilum acuticapitatum BLCC-M154]
MRTIENLPTPPSNKSGWPWNKPNPILLKTMANGSDWPKISIVTPSYNQGEFIEETIRSVLLQGYPNLEYIIIDGGSTDNTVDILKKYEDYISYWVSEPDGGQSHALNKGFQKATGDLIGWQNSDDYYAPGVFQYIAEVSQICDADVFYGTVDVINNDRNVMLTLGVQDFELEKMLPLFNLGNQSMFFRSKIFEDGLYISEKFDHFMDFDFFWRLIINEYIFCFVAQSHGYLRIHDKTKGTNQIDKASKELFETYKTPYLDDEKNVIPIEFKKKLLKAMKSVCLDNFAKSRDSIFRNQVRQIITISGWKFIDIDLYLKYLVSYLGLGATLQKTKRILKIPPSVYNI